MPVIKQMYHILNPASFVRQLMDMLLAKQVAIVKEDPLTAKWLRALTEGTLEEKEAARLGLSTVALSLKEIAEAQQEYSVYKLFGHSAYMGEAHLRANEAREKLRDLGIEEQYYNEQVNLAITNSDDPLLACRFNPIKDDGSPMPENEELLAFIQNVLAKDKADPMDRLQYALLEEKLRKIDSGELPPTHLPDGRLIDAYNKENETTFDYFQAHLKNENMQNPYLEYIVWLDDTYGKTEWRKKVETADAVVRGFGTGVIKGVIEGVVDTAGLAYQLVVDPQKVGQDMLYAAEYIIQNPEMVVEAAKQMYVNFESASPEEKAEMIGNVASILIPGVNVTKAGKAAKVPEALNAISHSALEAIKNVDWRTQFAKPQDWFNGLQSNRYFVTPEGIAIKVPDEPPSSVMKIDAGDGRQLEGTPKASIINISKNELGEHLGSGGNKDVYAYGNDEAVGVLKPGKPTVLLDDELKLLNKLDELGFPTVNARSVNVDGDPGLMFDRFAQGSKDIVRLQNGKIRIVGESSLLNQQSINDLNAIKQMMIEKKVKINDLQFLIGKDGKIVVADPLDVVVGEKPSANNIRMIDLLIEAAKKN
ncbi:hypothetical protein [Paenibacillus sp. 1001270B_150601_E10]|uniref:hypothetical protein n=1 Tax=Paenibacillus sp. 1001270B_150601_E10 TaxID=2787079 RepID=UPI001E3311D4|nr:hypothetical protein [Paenibacillus sp. 1001270B_150601_E10]